MPKFSRSRSFFIRFAVASLFFAAYIDRNP